PPCEDHASSVRQPHTNSAMRIRCLAGFHAADEISRPQVGRPQPGIHAVKQHALPVGRESDANIVALRVDSSAFPPGSIEPDELREVGMRLVNQVASARRGKIRTASQPGVLNWTRERENIADRNTPREIKPFGDKRALSSKDKVVRIDPLNVRNRGKYRDRRFSWFREFDVPVAIRQPCQVEKTLAVRQKPRPPDGDLSRRRVRLQYL